MSSSYIKLLFPNYSWVEGRMLHCLIISKWKGYYFEELDDTHKKYIYVAVCCSLLITQVTYDTIFLLPIESYTFEIYYFACTLYCLLSSIGMRLPPEFKHINKGRKRK